jgi:hypothetical protein
MRKAWGNITSIIPVFMYLKDRQFIELRPF